MSYTPSRRQFAKVTAATAAAIAFKPFYILNAKPKADGETIGHGNFRYKVNQSWGNLDASKFPVNNCHEMVQDSKGRLIMVTDEIKNNILIYDRSGKLLESWGHEYPGGHGLTLWNANGEEFLFITDPNTGKVIKTDLKGKVLLTIEHPSKVGAYKETDPFKPTETAIGPDGTLYIADGYGSNYILRYNQKGEFIDKFGGSGDGDAQFSTAHGIAVDYRDKANPTLLVTSRAHNAFKRFSLDGKYLSTIFLPGAFVCRPVFHGENLFAGVCWSRLRYLNQTPNSGFVTILDKSNKVISNPGGTKPEYKSGELQLMVQEKPIFMHCHDVCVDGDQNIYVCQWNAKKTYPVKLERV
ncbi:6-bladed beta-propeller [Dyadobacter sp. Leaf189]|uniref:6-bladed beta-propeller n=1 Tax=Dyadobacter sp. Leaf189 TaxID=1736295 RepID=UPI0006FF6789|nr:6-bladed beta-propeller [Dyadobacter sp. Leaf189]KQS33250.1 peptidylglycine monooxygenase [Dyadobacter sp. Leaf189]